MLKTIAIVAGLQFASTHVLVLAQTFSADAAAAAEETSTGQAGSEAGAENTAALEPVDDIRDISDNFCADGNAKSAAGLSNMVWSFGQFVDHDLALSLDNERSPTIAVETATDVMELTSLCYKQRRGCRNSLNVHTPIIDAGPIYGSDEQYLQGTLPRADTCFYAKAREGGFLPLTTAADTPDGSASLPEVTANEIDGRLSDALRNFLFGRSEGQDLAGRNIFRSRELGLPTYAGMAECFGITPDAT
eukprot:jgi/Ulvmu1/6364/UM290_0001.1